MADLANEAPSHYRDVSGGRERWLVSPGQSAALGERAKREGTPADKRGAGNLSPLLLGVAAALALLYVLRDIVVPLFVALLLLALIDGQVRGLKRHWPRAPNWMLTSIAVASVIAAVGACVAVLLLGAGAIVADAPVLLSRIDGMLAELSRALGAVPVSLNDFVDQGALMALVKPAVASISNLLAGATLIILYLGFMLASRQTLATKVASLARTPDGARLLRNMVERIGQGARTYMWVQTVTGALYAGCSGLVLYCIGLDNVAFWTILIFLLSYIPMLGVAIASTCLALFALVQFSSYWQAIAVFAAVQGIAFVVGNLVLPKMQADSQNIDPAVGIFSVALWTLLWGVPGAFLAIPLTAMAMIVFAQLEQTRWAAVLISDDGVPERYARRKAKSDAFIGSRFTKPIAARIGRMLHRAGAQGR